jgi:hypothetical protein
VTRQNLYGRSATPSDIGSTFASFYAHVQARTGYRLKALYKGRVWHSGLRYTAGHQYSDAVHAALHVAEHRRYPNRPSRAPHDRREPPSPRPQHAHTPTPAAFAPAVLSCTHIVHPRRMGFCIGRALHHEWLLQGDLHGQFFDFANIFKIYG